MKLRRLSRFHGLKRPRVRQTWNKFNLYNLYRLREPSYIFHKTFFQQKWWAKAATRAYHGEHIKERKWELMFNRRLLSAVDMDPAYLAANDGSELASGRGSGLHQRVAELRMAEDGEGTTGRDGTKPARRPAAPCATPYMQMTYAPLERRLDQAIFRALFASSARQARQFCVHGAVKVNGVKMKYPGYLLNPGDMFQVDVDRVMTATGRRKPPANKTATPKKENTPKPAAEAADGAAESQEAVKDEAFEELDEAAAREAALKALERIKEHAKLIITSTRDDLSAKRKRAFRALIRDARSAHWHVRKSDSPLEGTDNTIEDLAAMLLQLELSPAEAKAKEKAEKEASEADVFGLSQDERKIFEQLVQADKENPIDPSKPYATPWKPRPYMPAFAFIPRYLEVNQKICSAVYLRHPVARQGLAEVPTPFPFWMNQLAFNWYLRRG
ncbi:30S ribosomal subunit [Apodospora peruviana]|uniref:Small ribosomal subunit protein uS4m n=1 Tax=Apodospora peruviana TaxID=516989 RepID=A0AAE0I4G7_9PEZI|nr:30S ribosomal subunit [Apodospora peruviana]